MQPSKVVSYRSQQIKQNPLTGDWLVNLGTPYGAYYGELKAIKEIIDRYWQHKETEEN